MVVVADVRNALAILASLLTIFYVTFQFYQLVSEFWKGLVLGAVLTTIMLTLIWTLSLNRTHQTHSDS